MSRVHTFKTLLTKASIFNGNQSIKILLKYFRMLQNTLNAINYNLFGCRIATLKSLHHCQFPTNIYTYTVISASV